MICACDSTRYWRTKIFPEYKANRKDDDIKRQVRGAITHFKKVYPHLCLELEQCEADDIICAVTINLKEEITIVSSDRDFIQLISDRVSLYDPNNSQFRPKPKNAAQALFIKCIRGDKADNIPSAYPYVTTKRLQSAFKSAKSLSLLLDTPLANGCTVNDRYLLNRQLIDLSCIPNTIKRELKAMVSVAQIET